MTWATIEIDKHATSWNKVKGGFTMRKIRSPQRQTVELVLPLNNFRARCLLKGVLAFLDRETDKGGERIVAASHRGPGIKLLVRNMSEATWLFDETRPGGTPSEPEVDLSVVCFGDASFEKRLRVSRGSVLSVLPNGELADGFVRFNVAKVGLLAGEHLADRGLTTFAFIGDMRRNDAKQLLIGFRDALAKRRGNKAKAEIAPSSSVAVLDTNHLVSGKLDQSELGNWLAALPKPTGVLGATEILAYNAVLAAREHSMHIPNELAVVAAGGDPSICKWSHPEITSIELDFVEVGLRVGRAIVVSLQGGTPDEIVAKPVEPGPLALGASSDFLSDAPRYVAAALAYIRENGGEGINVKMVAGALGVSRRKLERDFHRYVGSSPREEIRKQRAAKLQQLLGSDLPLSRIARETGFSSAQYMAKFFQAATGTSLHAVRERKRRTSGGG